MDILRSGFRFARSGKVCPHQMNVLMDLVEYKTKFIMIQGKRIRNRF